jgi:HEPN domain-containing protein
LKIVKVRGAAAHGLGVGLLIRRPPSPRLWRAGLRAAQTPFELFQNPAPVGNMEPLWYKVSMVIKQLPMKLETKRWLAQAEEDFLTAQVNLKGQRFYVVALFAQQAAEKVLKALIIQRTGEMPPKIHSLVGLGKHLSAPQELEKLLEQLDPSYLNTRYPDAEEDVIPAESYQQNEAMELLAIAEKAVTWVKSQL